MFGGPVRADRISYCPLDRVLTYKNLIYLLNLQFSPIHCNDGISSSEPQISLFLNYLIIHPRKPTLYEQYHTTLSTLIDKHAPPYTKNTKAKYIPGRVNEMVITAKSKRLFEHIWRQNMVIFKTSKP